MKRICLFILIALITSCDSEIDEVKEESSKKVTFRFTNTYNYAGDYYFDFSLRVYYPNENQTAFKSKILLPHPGLSNTYTWDFQDSLIYKDCIYQVELYVRDYEKNPVRESLFRTESYYYNGVDTLIEFVYPRDTINMINIYS